MRIERKLPDRKFCGFCESTCFWESKCIVHCDPQRVSGGSSPLRCYEDSGSIRKALKAGDSVGLFPGGVAEMVRTDGNQEKLLLRSRKGRDCWMGLFEG